MKIHGVEESSMERIVKVNIDVKIARSMLGVAGFNKVATQGTDEDVFNQVLDMITYYGAQFEVINTADNVASCFKEQVEDI